MQACTLSEQVFTWVSKSSVLCFLIYTEMNTKKNCITCRHLIRTGGLTAWDHSHHFLTLLPWRPWVCQSRFTKLPKSSVFYVHINLHWNFKERRVFIFPASGGFFWKPLFGRDRCVLIVKERHKQKERKKYVSDSTHRMSRAKIWMWLCSAASERQTIGWCWCGFYSGFHACGKANRFSKCLQVEPTLNQHWPRTSTWFTFVDWEFAPLTNSIGTRPNKQLRAC